MAKSDKRQMIILGVMGIAVLYGVFDYFTPKRRASSPDLAQKTAELNSFVTDLTAGLGKDRAKNLHSLIFSRAEREWTRDPFLDARSYRAWNAAKTPARKEGGAVVPKIEFIYSGYIETDRKRMAIINGIEYAEGENLDVKGYVLKNVSPTRVVIENQATGAAAQVPLLE